MSISPMELEEIQDRVRGMTKEQMQAALSMIPYELIYQEMFVRYEHLIKKYTEDIDRVSGAAISIDTMPHS